ncbi:TRAFs-binding domain-containing protein [Nitrosomonas sp.]|uniref:TRAFs-binding domain-containing protein n=1 Tax=Nitrosomonas sp. TaxID=42353 RepID=UPI002631C377|nr:TRAFs-binding domain-containing protein [Nitrosomonas sp.]
MNPYCFVITSFGKKENLNDIKLKQKAGTAGPVQEIDFDRIYNDLVKPAILQAGLEPLIESEERAGGSIHKTMYEKIILCEFCIADLTNLNPNAYYELGMRYAVKPFTTIPIIASSHFPLPFDIASDRTFIYNVDENFNLSNKQNDIDALVKKLQYAKQNRATDSPLYDLINGIAFQNSVAHEKTDVFRDKVQYDEVIKKELAYARNRTDDDPNKIKALRIQAINQIVEKYQPLENIETAVLIDIMISYRNIEAFNEMQAFIKRLPRYVFETVMVQEQYAFVLNRNGGKAKPVDNVMIQEAEDVLQKLESEGKASSESYGIWGRIYKDKFDRAYKAGSMGEAMVYLENALTYYQKGFESDPRDAYPGVNYVTCLELQGKREEALRLLPAVEYAVNAKMKRKEPEKPDYWDYATLLELAVIESRFSVAEKFFYKAKPLEIEAWMFGTTKENLSKILNFRKERNETTADLDKLIGLFG